QANRQRQGVADRNAARADAEREHKHARAHASHEGLSDSQRRAVANRLTSSLRQLRQLRDTAVGYEVAPALLFVPAAGQPAGTSERGQVRLEPVAEPVQKPKSDADLAYLPVYQLAELVRKRQVSAVELTRLYLDRLRRYDPALLCVVTLTEELALKQAEQADREIAAGQYRGPLHGIPWVAKDLIAYPGYPTTWGAAPFREQRLEQKATVAARLDQAGAVLVAKTSLGALAQGDQWFGGQTRNPWNPKQGSSGSSAGTAAAVAAGLCGFGLGSETLGSIVSPSARCGVTGLRPTFGRVSRQGCMPLAWSLDKIGPMARCVVDCALVLGAIHGADPHDPTTVDRPFHWPGKKPLKQFRVGYFEEKGVATPEADLKVLQQLGVQLVPITLPWRLASTIIGIILEAEAATAFDDLTRAGVHEGIGNWAITFRRARFTTAVDYLRAQRLRTLLQRHMHELFEKIDVYVGGNDLAVANLTGHPTICLPNGFSAAGTPTALTFTGRLYGETDLLTLAQAYQEATGYHRRRPPEDKWVPLEKPPAKQDKQ
ncbi:MAG: amidase, partial [Gemmataceae bacterium]|nr:amidase [Gemmataceae bacterium]